MRDFTKNRRGRVEELLARCEHTRSYSTYTAFVFFGARRVGYVSKIYQEASGEDRQRSKNYNLCKKKKEDNTAVEALSSERGIEAEIRARFGVAKPGEGEDNDSAR